MSVLFWRFEYVRENYGCVYNGIEIRSDTSRCSDDILHSSGTSDGMQESRKSLEEEQEEELQMLDCQFISLFVSLLLFFLKLRASA